MKGGETELGKNWCYYGGKKQPLKRNLGQVQIFAQGKHKINVKIKDKNPNSKIPFFNSAISLPPFPCTSPCTSTCISLYPLLPHFHNSFLFFFHFKKSFNSFGVCFPLETTPLYYHHHLSAIWSVLPPILPLSRLIWATWKRTTARSTTSPSPNFTAACKPTHKPASPSRKRPLASSRMVPINWPRPVQITSARQDPDLHFFLFFLLLIRSPPTPRPLSFSFLSFYYYFKFLPR